MTGHLLGAAAAVEAVYSVLALHHGVLPPTINQFTSDPECDLDYIPHTARFRSRSRWPCPTASVSVGRTQRLPLGALGSKGLGDGSPL